MSTSAPAANLATPTEPPPAPEHPDLQPILDAMEALLDHKKETGSDAAEIKKAEQDLADLKKKAEDLEVKWKGKRKDAETEANEQAFLDALRDKNLFPQDLEKTRPDLALKLREAREAFEAAKAARDGVKKDAEKTQKEHDDLILEPLVELSSQVEEAKLDVENRGLGTAEELKTKARELREKKLKLKRTLPGGGEAGLLHDQGVLKQDFDAKFAALNQLAADKEPGSPDDAPVFKTLKAEYQKTLDHDAGDASRGLKQAKERHARRNPLFSLPHLTQLQANNLASPAIDEGEKKRCDKLQTDLASHSGTDLPTWLAAFTNEASGGLTADQRNTLVAKQREYEEKQEIVDNGDPNAALANLTFADTETNGFRGVWHPLPTNFPAKPVEQPLPARGKLDRDNAYTERCRPIRELNERTLSAWKDRVRALVDAENRRRNEQRAKKTAYDQAVAALQKMEDEQKATTEIGFAYTRAIIALFEHQEAVKEYRRLNATADQDGSLGKANTALQSKINEVDAVTRETSELEAEIKEAIPVLRELYVAASSLHERVDSQFNIEKPGTTEGKARKQFLLKTIRGKESDGTVKVTDCLGTRGKGPHITDTIDANTFDPTNEAQVKTFIAYAAVIGAPVVQKAKEIRERFEGLEQAEKAKGIPKETELANKKEDAKRKLDALHQAVNEILAEFYGKHEKEAVEGKKQHLERDRAARVKEMLDASTRYVDRLQAGLSAKEAAAKEELEKMQKEADKLLRLYARYLLLEALRKKEGERLTRSPAQHVGETAETFGQRELIQKIILEGKEADTTSAPTEEEKPKLLTVVSEAKKELETDPEYMGLDLICDQLAKVHPHDSDITVKFREIIPKAHKILEQLHERIDHMKADHETILSKARERFAAIGEHEQAIIEANAEIVKARDQFATRQEEAQQQSAKTYDMHSYPFQKGPLTGEASAAHKINLGFQEKAAKTPGTPIYEHLQNIEKLEKEIQNHRELQGNEQAALVLLANLARRIMLRIAQAKSTLSRDKIRFAILSAAEVKTYREFERLQIARESEIQSFAVVIEEDGQKKAARLALTGFEDPNFEITDKDTAVRFLSSSTVEEEPEESA